MNGMKPAKGVRLRGGFGGALAGFFQVTNRKSEIENCGALSAGMELLVNCLYPGGIDVCVYLCGGDVGVAEHLLDAS